MRILYWPLRSPFSASSRFPGVFRRHQTVSRVQAVEPQHGLPLESLERLNPVAFEKDTGSLVAETYNHSLPYQIICYTSSV